MHKAIEAFQAANRVFDFVNITSDLIQQDENGRTSRGQERATNHSAKHCWMRDKIVAAQARTPQPHKPTPAKSAKAVLGFTTTTHGGTMRH